MGNFQWLAEQVLIRHKVSSFPPLAKETGNFYPHIGNIIGNRNKEQSGESQYRTDKNKETNKETNGKPLVTGVETITEKNIQLSFLIGKCTEDIINQFFSNALNIGIELLPDDKCWLKTITFDVSAQRTLILLEKYIENWCDAMSFEPINHKKQNAGRFSANTFIRNELLKK